MHPPVVLVQPADLPPAVHADEAEVVVTPGRKGLSQTRQVRGRENMAVPEAASPVTSIRKLETTC